MSTRGSLYLHEDEKTGVVIHIYRETVACDTPSGLRIEIEHPCGVTNVAWPGDWDKTKRLGEDVADAADGL